MTALLAITPPIAALLLLPVSYSARQSHGEALNRSAVERVWAAFQGNEEHVSSTFNVSIAELLETFRRQTASPPLDDSDPRIGSEAGGDILLFVMETIPSRTLDLPGADEGLPGIGRLLERSFVGRRHFTTYPYTSDALYSILSGWYPQGRRKILQRPELLSRIGLMNALESRGYRRAVYAPSLYNADLDDRKYATFGAAEIYYATGHPAGAARQQAARRTERLLSEWEKDRQPFDPEVRGQLAERLTHDLQALEQMKQGIAETKRAGDNFCSVFLPQIGHAPWFDLHGRAEIVDRGRDIALLQDRWLAEILDFLDANGWLDSTIVVLTSDHGIRTKAEDPALPFGKLSSFMLEVPLIIQAPGLLDQPVEITVPTSHIDITPTVLALLWETSSIRYMQGVPVWQRSADNQIFLFGSDYVGADGFVRDGSFYMQHAFSGAVFKSDHLDFRDDHLLLSGETGDSFARRSIRQTRTMQLAMIKRLLTNGLPEDQVSNEPTSRPTPPEASVLHRAVIPADPG